MKFMMNWNYFKLYNSLQFCHHSVLFNRTMNMNRIDSHSAYIHFLLWCNKWPQTWKIHIYYLDVSIDQLSWLDPLFLDLTRLKSRCQVDPVFIWSLAFFSELIQVVGKCFSWWSYDLDLSYSWLTSTLSF